MSAHLSSGADVFLEVADDGRVESVELWKPRRTAGPVPTLGGVQLWGLPVAEVLRRWRTNDARVSVDADSVILRDFDLGLTVEAGRVRAVLVAAAGYYDFLDET